MSSRFRRALATTLSLGLLSLMPHSASAQNAAENKALVQEMMEAVFNRHDLGKIDKVVADDYLQHNPLVPPGRAGLRSYMQATLAAVPDWHFELVKISAEGDMVWTYGAYIGTPTSQWGPIPPTGKPFKLVAADLWRVKDGKIVAHWDVLDIQGMLRQLGMIPPLGARPPQAPEASTK